MIQPNRALRMSLFPCFVAFSFFLLTGCGANPVNKENSDRIKSGMTEGDVDRILGKGKDLSAEETEQVLKRLATPAANSKTPSTSVDKDISSLKGVRWGSEKKSITVIYRDGRVYKIEAQGL